MELQSLNSLRANRHLWSLYLLGNPCDQWHGYRRYVTGALPQLRSLVRRSANSVLSAVQALAELRLPRNDGQILCGVGREAPESSA